jgi:hypothetical protein
MAVATNNTTSVTLTPNRLMKVKNFRRSKTLSATFK